MRITTGSSSIWADIWKGHLLQFDKLERSPMSNDTGKRILLGFLVLAFVARPLFKIGSQYLYLSDSDWKQLVQVIFLLASAALITRLYCRLSLDAIGLNHWRVWTRREKLYFIQVIPLACAVFGALLFPEVQLFIQKTNPMHLVMTILIPALLWGFFQEFVYRGLLQTELIRRFGVVLGVGASNLLFTFGPLHFYHFGNSNNPQYLWIFVAIFSIGLFFSLIYHRTGNLWIVGIMHGIGDLFIDGLGRAASS